MPSVLITGGHKGLGREAACRIAASRGRDLLLAGRDLKEMEPVAHGLRAEFGVKVAAVHMDVSSLASVRTGAAEVKAIVARGDVDPLDGLMLNAGAQFLGPTQHTADGYERTFATNCLGHFLLLNLLIDQVQDGGRIVFTASGTHDPATMDGKMVGRAVEPDATRLARDDAQEKALTGGVRYATSKLCTIMYAYELDRRLRSSGSGIQSIAFDPGLMMETGLARSAPAAAQWVSRTKLALWIFKTLGVTMGAVPFSGKGLADLAIAPAFARASGKYIQSRSGEIIEARSSKTSYDERTARKLWADSEALVGLKPEERPSILNGGSIRPLV